MKIYLIGSLRNANVPELGKRVRALGHDVVDDWHAAGPEADDYWQQHETRKEHTYKQALQSRIAKHVFSFDYNHLKDSDAAILLMPGGKSAHLEAGFMVGQGKPVWVLFDKTPERYDQMYQFVFTTGGDVFLEEQDLIDALKSYKV